MSNNRKTVLTVIASLVVFGIIQSGTGEGFTIKQYLGKWYSVGALHMERREPHIGSSAIIPCEWRDVTEHADGRVEEVYTFIFRGRLEKCEGNVTLTGSELCIVYPDGPHFFTVNSYNDGEDLILFDERNVFNSVMISRKTQPSTDAIESFEKFGADVGGYAHYIDNSECM